MMLTGFFFFWQPFCFEHINTVNEASYWKVCGVKVVLCYEFDLLKTKRVTLFFRLAPSLLLL